MAVRRNQPSSPRRTQAERSSATRRRLLEATIDVLVAQGHAGATTAAIEARAGVSRGARMHHFPSKAELLSAAVEHLFLGLRESFESRIKLALELDELPQGDRFKAVFQLLWSNFLDPRHAAVLELFMLARGDAALSERLREVTRQHHENMQRRARAYFPEVGPELARMVPPMMESIHATMEGLALRRVVFGEDLTEKLVLETIEDMTRHLVADTVQRLIKTGETP